MRVIKQRLLEMVFGLRVFLDVDDLVDIGDLEGYIERSKHVLVFCTNKYFASKNCMRELVHSTKVRSEMSALIELDKGRGGLDVKEVCVLSRARRGRLGSGESVDLAGVMMTSGRCT